MAYQPRLIDSLLTDMLSGLPAIAVEGAKGVGKTATASRLAGTVIDLDNPQTREAINANPALLTELERPVFIDEWQLVPETWDTVRRAVDREPGGRGMFLLAGSSGVGSDARIHSGAGRIVRFAMRPMTMQERGLDPATVSLSSLLAGEKDIAGASDMSMADYVDEILASGFPGIRRLDAEFRAIALDSYLSRIVDSDIRELGVRVRKPALLMAWLRAYGAATSTTTEYSKLLNAATAGEPDKPARQTVDAYREHLTRLFLLDPLPPWIPTFSPLKRLTVSSKHHLVDPALAARLAGVEKPGLLIGEGQTVSQQTGSWLGALFESLVTQSVRVYAETSGLRVGHLRTKSGDREIDLVLEGPNRRCLAVEVKLSPTPSDAELSHLHWFRKQMGEQLVDAIVVTTGAHAYRRKDGIAVVPLSLLGP